MSDKQTAYRGETFHSMNDAEVPQNGQMIDPVTGLPVQQWQQNPQGYAPQEGYAPQTGYVQPGQAGVGATDYAQNGQYQGGAVQGQNVYQEPAQDAYGTTYQQQNQLPDYSAQNQFQQNQFQQGYEQPVDQTQQSYEQPQQGFEQPQQGYEQAGTFGYTDPNAQNQYAQNQYAQNQYVQPGQEVYQTGYAPEAYAAETYVEEDPYLAAHQNATLPFDAAQNDVNGQYEQNVYAAEAYQGQVYQDPNYYGQAQVDAGHSPAHYNGAGDQFAVPQDQYAQPGYDQGAMDYNGQYAAQQQLPQGMAQINDPFAPAPLQQVQSDTRDATSSGRKSFLVGAMILGSVIIGGGVAAAYKYSGESGDQRAPLILSDGSDAKVAPENPGGREFQNQNKKIFDRLGDGGALAKAAVSGEPEVVQSLRGDVSGSVGDGKVVNGARLVRTFKINRNGDRMGDNSASFGQEQQVKDYTGVSVDTGKASRVVKTSREGKVAQRAPVERRVAALEQTRRAPVTTTGGDFVVQISARRTQPDALAAFSGLQSRYGDVLTGYRPLIQRADLGTKGIFYRLRVGPMASKESALAVCNKLKSKGLKGCFATRR